MDGFGVGEVGGHCSTRCSRTLHRPSPPLPHPTPPHPAQVQLDNPRPFSRGIRKTLYLLCRDEGWKEKHSIYIVE